MPGLKWALPWAGIAFWLSFFGLNCVQMAPGRAESDFGLQGWIDTLELKQIFLIFSVCKNAFTFLEIEINFKESQLPFGWEKRIRATRKWPINSLQTHPKKGFFWGYPLPLPNDITIDSSLYLGYVKNFTRYITFHICYELSPPEKCSFVM